MVSWAALLDEAVRKPGYIHQAYSRFHNYSLGNQLLALFQCFERSIQPGPLATFPKWKELGRYVKKGEKALTLCINGDLWPLLVFVSVLPDSFQNLFRGDIPHLPGRLSQSG